MQIQNDQIVVAQGRGKERPVELKKGEVYQVKVKETRLGEATVQLRGKEIQIAVTGALKAGEEATVEVIGERNGKPVMKPLPNVPVAQKNIAETTFQVKHVNKDVNQALDSFFKQGVPLTKETVADLQQFFKQAKGTDAEKLQTAQALATKQLVPTSAHLKAVHEALFGEPLQKTLQNVAKALNVPLETTKENPIATLKQKIEKEPQRVIAIVKEALQSLPEEVQRQVKVAVEEAEKNPTKARKIVVAALEKTLTLNQHEIKNGVREQMSHQSQGTKTEALHQKVAQTTTKEQAMDMIREAIQSESWTKQERAFLARAIQTAETLPENSRDYLLKQIKAMDTVRQIKEMSSQPHVRENVKDLKEIIGQIESLKGTVSLKESIEKVEKQIQVGRTVEAKEMLTKAVRDFEKSVQQPPTHSLEKIGQMKETFAKEPNFLKAIERMTTQMRESSFSVKSMEKTEQLLQQAAKLYKDGHVAKSHQLITQGLEKMTQEVLGQMKQEVIREPNSQKAIETVKRVANQSTLSKEISNPLQKVVQEAEVLAKVNRGQEAKSRIVNQLNQLISSHQSVEKAVHLLKQIVEKAETGQKAVEHVQKEVSTRLELPKEIQSKVNQALKESEALVKIGHDNEAKVHLQKQLDMVTSAKSVDLAKILDQFTRESTIQKAIKTVKQVATNETLPREVTDKLQKAIQTAETFVKLGQGAEAKAHLKNQLQASIEQLKQADIKIIIDQAKNQISREPSVQKAMEIAKQVASNSTVPKEIADRLQKVIQEVDVLTRMGRGIAAKTRLENQLTNISNQLAKNESPAQAVETMKQVAANESTGQKAAERVRQELAQRPELPKEIANKITQALKESDVLIKIGRDTEAKAHLQKQLQALTMPTKQVDMQATLEQVTREPNVQKAIETVKQVATNPTLPKEVADKLQQAVQTAETFVKLGRGTEAKAQLQNQLQTVATKNSPAQTIETLKQIAANESTGQKAVERVRQELAQRPELPKEIAYKVTQALKESDALVKAGRDAEAKVHLQQQLQTIAPTSKQVDIPSTIEQVNREPNVQKAIETVKQVATNPTLSKEVADKVQQAVQIAETFAKVGRIPEAKEQLQQVLQSVANTPKSQQGVQQLEQVAKTTPVDRAIQKIRDAVSESTELPPEVKAKVQETVQQAKQLLEEGKQAESKQLLQDGLQQARVMESKQLVNPSPRLTTDQVETLQKQLQKEPSVEKMIQSVLKEVQNIEKDMPELSKKVQEKLEEATSFKEKGREMKARNAIQEAVQEMMTKAEKPVESNAAEQLLQQQEEQQWMQSVQHFTSKDLVVTRVTEKLAQAAIDFKQTKRDLMKNLDSIDFLTKQFQKNAAPQIRQMLESTIKTLDQTILKSDMMMLTDMKTEKQLIQASSQLAEAKKLLDKGDLKGVQTIVRDVKGMLERLQFKPQDVRIQHFVMQEEEAIKMYKPQEQLIRSFTETLRTQATFEHSARGVYEQVRTMGLNYDSEVGQMLVSEKDMNLSKNMKQALLQLAEQQENTQVRQAAEQALNNVTGQQLLSKSDHGTTPQHLFFSLPLLLNKNVQNLQVYVNSKNQGEKVDWENCSLYFLLDTNKLGETGVLVNVVDRQLSVTLKNNLPDFEEKVSPLVEKATKRLEEVGYNMSSIQFRKLATEKAPTTEQETTNTPPSMPIFTEKGFDFTI